MKTEYVHGVVHMHNYICCLGNVLGTVENVSSILEDKTMVYRLSFCVPRTTKSTIEKGYLAKNNQVLFNGNLKGVFAKTCTCSHTILNAC